MPYDYYFKPTKPKEAKDGIKARSKRGAFAKSWWAQRWIAALERLMDSGRLTRGRSYARKGQVLSIKETKEGVIAKVQGSRRTPYKVKIQIAPLSDAQWEKVIDALAEQAIFTAQLLAGEMPQEIESAFEVAKVSLFPMRREDLMTDCSCTNYSNPCKHIAATHYILGERFDEDPFLIFRLRGRTQ
ncbi:MAG: SWIM zinc finger family protein, partial [Anaerolineaceae bacterium]|nr:SWIM zinc finger family protein [Anaerolineaceae bacterium]